MIGGCSGDPHRGRARRPHLGCLGHFRGGATSDRRGGRAGSRCQGRASLRRLRASRRSQVAEHGKRARCERCHPAHGEDVVQVGDGSLCRWVKNRPWRAAAPDATAAARMRTPRPQSKRGPDRRAEQRRGPGSIGIGDRTPAPEDDHLHVAPRIKQRVEQRSWRGRGTSVRLARRRVGHMPEAGPTGRERSCRACARPSVRDERRPRHAADRRRRRGHGASRLGPGRRARGEPPSGSRFRDPRRAPRR